MALGYMGDVLLGVSGCLSERDAQGALLASPSPVRGLFGALRAPPFPAPDGTGKLAMGPLPCALFAACGLNHSLTPQQQTKATADAAQEAPATPTPAATIPRQQATTAVDTKDLPTFLAIFQIRLTALNKTGDHNSVITALVGLSIDYPAR